MAHEESPREDLLREATALVERIELVQRAESANVSGDSDETIVAGFRPSGALSVFFGDDEVYHFNTAAELRRAYVDGDLYKAVAGSLVALTRKRTADQVELRSRSLTVAEQAAFMTRLELRLSTFAAELSADRFQISRQEPPNAEVVERLRKWLADHKVSVIASRPNV